MTLGERIKRLRRNRLTQQDLATAANVSVDVIRKLEQGRRHTASVPTLQRIAHALDVDLGDLFDRETMPEATADARITALRYAVSDVGDLLGRAPAPPLSPSEARRTVTYLWAAYWAGRYDTLTVLLPSALAGLRAGLHDAGPADRPQFADTLARTFWVAGCTLVHLRQTDAAFMAIRCALQVVEDATDALLAATLRGSVSWQLLLQGRFAEAELVAVRAAADIEPVGDVAAPHLSAYGALLLTAAGAAGRARRTGHARPLLAASREVADRIGSDRADYETAFGPSQVTMQTVDIAVVTENYDDAVVAAKRMPTLPGLPLASRARHRIDRAFAHTRLGQDAAALDLLLAADRMAPDWIRHQTLARLVIRELLDRESSRSARLRTIAERLAVSRTA